MKLYVGNLAHDVTEQELQAAFEAFGEVESVNIVMDRETGQSKGFGFVQMTDKDKAAAAIEGMNDKEINGQSVKVAEAKPKPKSNFRGGGFKRSGGFGGGGGGRGFGGGGGNRSGGNRSGGGGFNRDRGSRGGDDRGNRSRY